MSQPAGQAPPESCRIALILGVAQTLAWSVTYYLPAVVAPVVVADLGADPALVYGAFSLALLISGLAAPRVGRMIEQRGGRPVLLALGRAAGARPVAAGAAARAVGLGARLGGARHRHGDGAVRGRLRHPRRALWPGGAAADHPGHAGRRLRQHGRLADERGAGPAARLARHLPGLCGDAAAGGAAAVPAAAAAAATPAEAAPGPPEAADPPLPAAWVRRSFLLLAVFFTLRAIISATLSVHLIAVLGGLGLSVTAAVARGRADGPVPGRRPAAGIHPGQGGASADRGAAGRGPAATGALLLVLAGPVAAVPFVLLYGASNGIMTISRGALPLALFGPRGYPVLMGKLALPILLAQAGGADVDRAAGGRICRRRRCWGWPGCWRWRHWPACCRCAGRREAPTASLRQAGKRLLLPTLAVRTTAMQAPALATSRVEARPRPG